MKPGTMRAWLIAMLLAMSSATVAGETCKSTVMLPKDALLPGWETSPGADIPDQYWGQSIRALKPVRVVRSQANIAVVIEENQKQYSGFYFVTPESSYLPTNSPGRTFTCDPSKDLLRFVFQK